MAIDQSAYTFTPVTLPGIDGVPLLQDINNRGDIVGEFDALHGFLLRNGEVTVLDVPGAIRTVAQGINDRGDIVGTYLDPEFILHGFLYRHGDYTLLDIPGADYTDVTGINNRGQVVAFVSAGSTGTEPGGYIYENGAWSKITAPGNPNAYLVPDSINNRGVIVGSSENEGFVLDDGQLTLVDNPLSGFFIDFEDINNRGQAVGTLSPGQRFVAGFVYEDGEVTTFGPPAAVGRPVSWYLNGINDAGAVVGNYGFSGFQDEFAFLATPKAAGPPKPAHPAVDWNALAARVEANFAATGKWFVPDDVSVPDPAHPVVDWNALAAQVQANFAETGMWFL
ncbi:hypothetical protein [Belnapia moabensis]|uniref:hypothetical protein n=1 Tax=Belnapia moabensis TaxID=365533 RepID=UPI0005BAC7D9|nr:hypothetical protein [Belnapia moabensis]